MGGPVCFVAAGQVLPGGRGPAVVVHPFVGGVEALVPLTRPTGEVEIEGLVLPERDVISLRLRRRLLLGKTARCEGRASCQDSGARAHGNLLDVLGCSRNGYVLAMYGFL